MDKLNEVADALDQVLKEVREKFREAGQHQGIWESLRAFREAVDWREPWIIGLLTFQVLLFLVAVWLRRQLRVGGAIFAMGAAVVYFGERLNGVLGQHWKKFSMQPYFDPHGIFFSAVVSAPLLLTMFFLLVNYLMSASGLLISMKQKELRYNARQRARAEAGVAKKAR